MNHPTVQVWEGRWPLAADLHVHVRVYEERDGAYLLCLDYPPLGIAGEPDVGFTMIAGRGVSWPEVRSYLARCGMETGWEPTPPPRVAPPGARVALPVDAEPPRRVLFRPRWRPEPSARTRRTPPRLAAARRRQARLQREDRDLDAA